MVDTRRRHITVAIDQDLLERARGLAARRGCSISALLADELRRLVASERDYEAAMRRARALMATGLSLGGGQIVSRAVIHQRDPTRPST